MKTNYRSVYTAFDPYPSYKGSAIHIEKATNILSQQFPSTLLLTLTGHLEKRNHERIEHAQLELDEPNYLRRAMAFSERVDELLDEQNNLMVGHFRDIWGGLPILKRQHITSIFEVNGLPSIELVNRYPYIAETTLSKIRTYENECLEKSHLIICPSHTIKGHLVARGVMDDKIHVITNGADLPPLSETITDLPNEYIVYFGALQPWQGVDVLLKAMPYLRDKPELKLVICSSHKEKFSKPYKKLIHKLDIEEQVVWKHQLNKDILHEIISGAICTVAPLTECGRNLEQGCSPLKIFESMACKTPVVASDLPVVHEIIAPDHDGKLVPPDRPAELARAIRLLVDYPDFRQTLAKNAFQKFLANYTWKKVDAQLRNFYTNLIELAY
ncbi:MAG: glycosyltransferase [Bacteroidota bacterium]